MRIPGTRSIIGLLTLLAVAGCSTSSDPLLLEPRNIDGLTFRVPANWTEEAPESSMRRAQYVLGGIDGDATLVVYYFGAASAGSIDANMARWASQIEGDTPTYVNYVTDGLEIHSIEVAGRYVAPLSPGSSERPGQPAAAAGTVS